MTAQWADPPPIGGPQSPNAKWMERLRPLMDEPGRWAVVKSGTPSACSQTMSQLQQRQRHIPPGHWEFTVRTFRRGPKANDQYVASLYARWLGPDDSEWREKMRYRGVSPDAVWNEHGVRVCPECEQPLPQPAAGKWPSRCDACWAKRPNKYWRRKQRRVAEGA